jgi:prefoldin subunit 5
LEALKQEKNYLRNQVEVLKEAKDAVWNEIETIQQTQEILPTVRFRRRRVRHEQAFDTFQKQQPTL